MKENKLLNVKITITLFVHTPVNLHTIRNKN